MAIHRLAQMMWDVLRRRATSRSSSSKGRREVRSRLELTHLEERTLLATASGTLGGTLFIDANRNGFFDAGDRALNGVQVALRGTSNGLTTNASLITDAAGHYRFDNVPVGNFTLSGGIGFLPISAAASSTTFGGFSTVVTVGGGQTKTLDLTFRGIAPYYISLRQFINPITANTIPFGAPGSGVADAQKRGNSTPTLDTTRQLYGTTSGDLTVFATNGAKTSTLDLSGFFDDPDFTNSTVQIIASVGTTKETINVTLFDNAAPQTVANFFNYLLSNRYDNSIFHRFAQNILSDNSKQNFILQGGGFTVKTANGTTTMSDITADPAVQNEFSATRSNTLGTLAMAKLGDDPNSATSEFFFNLNDNSSNLNNQNEGFTVFGQLASSTDQTNLNALIAASASTPQTVNAKVTDGGTTTVVPFGNTTATSVDGIPLGPNTNLNNFPDNAKLTDFVRISDVKVTKRDEFLKYKVVSVKPLNGSPSGAASLIKSATIKDDRLNILTKSGAGTGQYEVTVRAIDKFGAHVDAKFTVKVGDAPTAASVTLSSHSPTTADTLVATVSAPALAGLPATYDFVWKVNGTTTKVETTNGTSTFDLSVAGNGDQGNLVTVSATPHLRNVTGLAVSDSATIAAPNANAPTFTSSNAASVVENTTAVKTVTATDPNNDPVAFTIVGGLDANKFNLAPNGVLTFITAPDFDAPGSASNSNAYQVVVQASDGTNVGTQTITVNVTNAPVTFTSSGTAIVSENTTKVLTVVADSSEDGKPTYRISGGADAGKFTIDSDTGALSFTTAPNFEANGAADNSNNYKVQVIADDGKGGTANQSITVTVTNAGVQFTSSNVVSVPTGTTAVMTVTADSSEPGNPTLTLTGGADQALFNFSTANVLSFKVAPNFASPGDSDHDNVYTVVITANDNQGSTTTQTINISVTNGAVTFTSGNTATVAENTPIATKVLTVAATTTAAGGPITFALSGPDAGKFNLAANGNLTFVAVPDFEAQSAAGNNIYTVVVTANDGQGGTAIQTITVTVTNAPVTFSSPATASVVENTTAVLTVVADSSETGNPTYKITGGADSDKFTIDPITGALNFKTAPNFEAKASAAHNNIYKVTVTANDGQGGSNTQAITVTVTNGPKITSANTFSVEENTTAAGTVTSTPGDGAVKFTLTGGADKLKFNLDATTGALSFKTAPNFEAPGSAANSNAYVVVVTATDSTGSKNTQTITVNVTNAAVNFSSPNTASVAENTTAVLTVAADSSEAGSPTYGLTANPATDNALFDMNATTGALTFKTAPDFENPTDANTDNVYVVEVAANDGQGGTATQTIHVTVTNAVVSFTSSAAQTVVEGNTAVTTVAATSTDGTVSFSINGGDDATAFSITSDGMLTFNTPPLFGAPTDMNGDNVYLVQVMGNDGHGGTANQLIAVTVTT